MKASVYCGPRELRVEERPIPTLEGGDLLIRVDFCGLCGTDIKKIERGMGTCPSVLGHEVTGTVVESRSARFDVGDRLAVAHHVPCFNCHYCRHGNISMCAQFKTSHLDPGGYSEYCRIPARHVEHTAFKLERLSQEAGVFMEPLACIVRNLDRHALLPGDLAVSVGLGSIGLLTSQALAARGVQVIGLDLKPERLALAKRLGLREVLNPELGGEAIAERIRAASAGRGADFISVSAGPPSALSTYLDWLRPGGVLNLFASLYPETPAPLSANTLYHREIQITTSYSASPEALLKAHRLLEDGTVQVAPLISEIYALDGILNGIQRVNAQEAMKVLIAPGLPLGETQPYAA